MSYNPWLHVEALTPSAPGTISPTPKDPTEHHKLQEETLPATPLLPTQGLQAGWRALG